MHTIFWTYHKKKVGLPSRKVPDIKMIDNHVIYLFFLVTANKEKSAINVYASDNNLT